MFVNAIKECSGFVRPIFTGTKTYGSDEIYNGIATIIVLNNEGWFLTCKHVAEVMKIEGFINQKYQQLLNEFKTGKEPKKQIEKRVRIKKDDVVLMTSKFHLQLKDTSRSDYSFIVHDFLDLALGQFTNNEITVTNYPIFSKSDPEHGQTLCKLGFPFPEYDCFALNPEKNEIIIKSDGNFLTPLFPLEGMMTRNVIINGKVNMFELSTPGLKGQSGGPIFDSRGFVYGIQSETVSMDLDFDFHGTVKRSVGNEHVDNQPMLYLGRGVNSSAIREFLDANNVKYKVEE